jgi:hypothetical protein
MKIHTFTGKLLFACTFIALLAILPMKKVMAQLSVSPNKTASELANALVGTLGGVTIVGTPTLTCPGNANGTFSTASSPLAISGGILLTSGSAGNAASDANSPLSSVNNGAAGDATLTSLSGFPTNDACVLEFDFTSDGDAIQFDYQFASEEYTSYTCTQFNDVFGFFISGNEYGTPTNLALVPNTSIPVAINSINGGSPTGAGVIANCNNMGPGSPFPQYFISNTGANPPVYDGLTTVLTAAASVTPCSTYHLKLAIADASDFILDSGVFLEEGSLTISPPVISNCPANQTINSTAACDQTATWIEPTVVQSTCNPVTLVRSHAPGDVFPVGTTTVTYVFTNAGGSSTCSFNVTVTDITTCAITVTQDNPTNICTNGGVTDIFLGYGPQSATMTVSVNGGAAGYSYSWSPATNLDDATIANPEFTPTSPGSYTYTVTATHPNGCTTTCSVTFCVKDVRVPGTNGKKIYICHLPPNDPTNVQTISVSINSVPTHVCAHGGDQLGTCDDVCGAAKTVGTFVNDVELGLVASPNPFVSDLHIRIVSHTYDYADLSIYDLTGKLIQTKAHQPVGTDLVIGKELVPGVYIVEVKHGDVSEKTKVIKIQ